MRVVSLLPSASELVGLLGAGADLVGRSHECDHVPGLDAEAIEAIPALTAPRTRYEPEAGADARAIDEQVRSMRHSGESLYSLDVDRLIELAPDVILTQDLCDVCSIDLASVRAAAGAVRERIGRAPEVVSLNPESFEDVLDEVLIVGRALDREATAERQVVGLRARMDRAQAYVNAYVDGPSVAFLEWTAPMFCGGHWTPQLIERAGGRHPLNPTTPRAGTGTASGLQQGERRAGKSVPVPPDLLVASAPERIVVCPCGLTLAQAADAVERDLKPQSWWPTLPAVRAGRVAIVDGNEMFNRPGPRLVDAFEWLVSWINDRPDVAPAGFPWREMS